MLEVVGATKVVVRVENEVPEDLFLAMHSFLAAHPQWDQRQLMQGALSGFLFQQGCKEPGVLRHYLDGLFRKPEGRLDEPAASIASA